MKLLNKIKNKYFGITHNWGIEPQLYKKLLETVIVEKKPVIDNNKNIYVECSYVGLACDTLKKMELAKELAEKFGGKIIFICDRKRRQLSKLLKKQKIKVIYEQDFAWKNPIIFLSAFLQVLRMRRKVKKGEQLLELCVEGILIGDCIYDYILRKRDEAYTIEDINWKRDFSIILNAVHRTKYINKQFLKEKPSFYLSGDFCYLVGIYVRLAQRMDAVVRECVVSQSIYDLPKLSKKQYPNQHEVVRYYLEKRESENSYNTTYINEYVENLLKNKFRGIGNKDTVCAFANKKEMSVEEIKSQMGLNPNKKNIVIMCHCFSDYAHCSSEMIFKDYYDWLEETLKIIHNINNVNWIIRAHPSRHLYGESDEVYELFEKYRTPSIFYFPDEYSGSVLKDFADALVTVQGTAGYEFACFGIPIVLSGNAFYSGYGYTVDNQSLDQYIETLQNMDTVTKLSEKQINRAKEIYYFRDNIFSVETDFEKLFYLNYQEFFVERDMQKWDNIMVESFIQAVSKGMKLM